MGLILYIDNTGVLLVLSCGMQFHFEPIVFSILDLHPSLPWPYLTTSFSLSCQ